MPNRHCYVASGLHRERAKDLMRFPRHRTGKECRDTRCDQQEMWEPTSCLPASQGDAAIALGQREQADRSELPNMVRGESAGVPEFPRSCQAARENSTSHPGGEALIHYSTSIPQKRQDTAASTCKFDLLLSGPSDTASACWFLVGQRHFSADAREYKPEAQASEHAARWSLACASGLYVSKVALSNWYRFNEPP